MSSLDPTVDTLGNFKRRTTAFLRQLHSTGAPLVLTVDGKAEVVVQDAEAYRRLVERAAKVDEDETVEALRVGLADADSGRVKPARRALKVLATKYGITTPGE